MISQQTLKDATTIQQDKIEQTIVYSLFNKLDKFKKRTTLVTVISAILFCALVGCVLLAWYSYQGLLSGVGVANTPIDIPQGVLEMEFVGSDDQFAETFFYTTIAFFTHSTPVILGMLSTCFVAMGAYRLLTAFKHATPELEFKGGIRGLILGTIFALLATPTTVDPPSSLKPLTKQEVITQLQSDDPDEFYHALSHIKERDDIDSAAYLEIQYKIKHNIEISAEDKTYIDGIISDKLFTNISRSSAYLFNQVSTQNNVQLLDMANDYEKEHRQKQEWQFNQYLMISGVVCSIFIMGFLASYSMRKRLGKMEKACYLHLDEYAK